MNKFYCNAKLATAHYYEINGTQSQKDETLGSDVILHLKAAMQVSWNACGFELNC